MAAAVAGAACVLVLEGTLFFVEHLLVVHHHIMFRRQEALRLKPLVTQGVVVVDVLLELPAARPPVLAFERPAASKACQSRETVVMAQG